MKIGFVGLGKLGMPCAVALAMKGHDVIGYDENPSVLNKRKREYKETGPDGVEPFDPYLENSTLTFGSLDQIANHSDIIFVAVQTPHDQRYEGVTRIPPDRVDFDYQYLIASIKSLSRYVKRPTAIVIISTVLPGTIRKHILPEINPNMKICYNPFFIAMGTTMRDFLFPEFVLFGVDDNESSSLAKDLYQSLTDAPLYVTSVESAELIKVSYNTFIGMKIVFANTIMEICHKSPGTNADDVMNAIKLANRRLISPAYLKSGMGDGGGCHPRDNIAMSWLARKLNLSYDFFDSLMTAREKQTEWLADLICEYDLPKVILGYSFKAETNLTTGSPAVLLSNLIRERGYDVSLIDPFIEGIPDGFANSSRKVFLLGAEHSVFKELLFPSGSVVIDPWRMLNRPQSDITYIPVGINGNFNSKKI